MVTFGRAGRRVVGVSGRDVVEMELSGIVPAWLGIQLAVFTNLVDLMPNGLVVA